MTRISKLFSIAVHIVVIGAAGVWSLVAPGLLPSPRSALAFHDVSLVKIADIPSPRIARPSAPSDRTVSVNAAPLAEPDRIAPETGRESAYQQSTGRSDVPAEVGADCHCVIPGELAPPPPPPAPPPPVKPIRLHAGMQAPQKIVDVKPIYPTLALTARREGLVILEAVIDSTGGVESVRVLKGLPLLDQAAVDAVKQWRFTPARLNNEPVPVVMTVTVSFQLK